LIKECSTVHWIAFAALAVLAGILNAPRSLAQSPAPRPAFEVASIKPCTAGEVSSGESEASEGERSRSPGRVDLNCQTVVDLIQTAYIVFANGEFHPLSQVPISGGSPWIKSDRYQITAKVEDTPRRQIMMGPMLQALLEDRFKLKIHRETREVSVYALTVAKGGPRLQASQKGSCIPLSPDDPPPSTAPGQPLLACGMFRLSANGGLDIHGATMADLADLCMFFSYSLDRGVIDKTGIAGMFDIHLELSPEASGDSAEPSTSTDPIFAAVHKLGLKLELTKGPGKFLVIDHVERPSPN